MLYIILVKKIAQDVKNIKETPNDAAIDVVTENVRRLIVQHHLGLVANLIVVILEFVIIIKLGLKYYESKVCMQLICI